MATFRPRSPRRRRPPVFLTAVAIGPAVAAVWFCISPLSFLQRRFWKRWPPFGADALPAQFELADGPCDWTPAIDEASHLEADRRFD